MSCWRNIASLPSRMITGDFDGELARPSRAPRRRTPPAGTTWLTIPIALAPPRPSIRSPSSSSSLVFLRGDVAVDQRHDHEREGADVDLGRAELGALLGDDQVARERDAERAGQHVPVGGADRRLAELADQLEQPREALGAEVLVHERHVGGEAGEVAARGEDLLVRGGEDDAAHGLVVAGRRERGDQLAEQLVRQRVARVGLVERDRRDAAPRPRSGASRRSSRSRLT